MYAILTGIFANAKAASPFVIITLLTQCGLVIPYGIMDLVNIGSGHGLLPDGTKP